MSTQGGKKEHAGQGTWSEKAFGLFKELESESPIWLEWNEGEEEWQETRLEGESESDYAGPHRKVMEGF